jgi:hypothetical protein
MFLQATVTASFARKRLLLIGQGVLSDCLWKVGCTRQCRSTRRAAFRQVAKVSAAVEFFLNKVDSFSTPPRDSAIQPIKLQRLSAGSAFVAGLARDYLSNTARSTVMGFSTISVLSNLSRGKLIAETFVQ